MGIHGELVGSDGRAMRLPDPAGGTFDAAGDFDELLPADPAGYPLLSRVDSFGETVFVPADMDELLREIDRLLPTSHPGPQRRGLLRLRALAARCERSPGSIIRFVGD
ncbi:hypothetical protein ACIA49_18820 [Kribbella sp. NPDC051587]|uniref:hypothetical protein n=1 Tax=Kribbella sp. NPDC051587 TaxID=3364119 RepID=UPI0037BC7C54